MKGLKLVLLFCCVWLLLVPSARVEAMPSIQGKFFPDPSVPVGTWFVGATPSGETKAPVLFVHGLGGSSSTWFQQNDMYDQAYAAGHPTAFINLHPDRSMWTNGELLSRKLAEMHRYFGEKIVVVGYSKGGVDMQSALLHYGATPYVEKIITLGSPHYGSPLADLAFSSWAGWLAAIIGQRNEATASLRTGDMAHFRAQTDPLARNSDIPVYTLSGTSWGSFGSELFFGGLYLSSFGPNDGAVTVQSSRLPYSQEIASRAWDHYGMKTGYLIFPYIREQLRGHVQSGSFVEEEYESANIMRGGEFLAEGTAQFFVEDEVSKMTLSLLASEELKEATLISPSGVNVSVSDVYEETEGSVFEGAYTHVFAVDEPVEGEWSIAMHSEDEQTDTGFLAITTIEGGISPNIEIAGTNGMVSMSQSKDVVNEDETSYTLYVNDELVATNMKMGGAAGDVAPLKRNTSQTLTMNVKGKTKSGKTFERTVIEHRYIDERGRVFHK
ncbi:esterase/lipase family protein [Shouchella lonarensis]|uniref:Triacylglycerol lipase n=1 Tax=Shouchella lonarensis TaxID=1464122 RepID=A0A1G6MQE8_9BACI|nr:hypothetical protein [Shouchella lonarensis]SDC57464.1 hypothetical protein SAMN05421737_110100 [Shouchella lonarensis]